MKKVLRILLAIIALTMSYGRGGYGGGGGYRGQGNFGGPKPVEAGKEYDVQITEISRQGDGIARVQGFVIFVKGGKVGQKAKVRIANVGARFATAEIVTGGGSGGGSTTEKQKDTAPNTGEEKPELQDYKSIEPGAGK
jgi:predicted RNA-binding protein with TRAM domain